MTEHLGSGSQYRTASTALPLTPSPWVCWDQISKRRSYSGNVAHHRSRAPVLEQGIQFSQFPFDWNWTSKWWCKINCSIIISPTTTPQLFILHTRYSATIADPNTQGLVGKKSCVLQDWVAPASHNTISKFERILLTLGTAS